MPSIGPMELIIVLVIALIVLGPKKLPEAGKSLGKLGNDRAYAKFAQREEVQGLPTTGAPGFYKILDAVTILESAGFGFGKAGSKPGQMYQYAEVAARTPTDPDVNTIAIS